MNQFFFLHFSILKKHRTKANYGSFLCLCSGMNRTEEKKNRKKENDEDCVWCGTETHVRCFFLLLLKFSWVS